MSLVWIILPTAVILLYSVVVDVIYVDRYLTFTAPAMALLLGACAVQVVRTPGRISLLLFVFAVAAAQHYVDQRTDYSKFGRDYSRVADLIAAHAEPGDCLVLDQRMANGPARAIVAARPDAYRDLVDVGLGEDSTVDDILWDRNVPLKFRHNEIEACTVIWSIEDDDPTLSDHEEGVALPPGPDFAATAAFQIPAQHGFRLVERWQFSTSQVTRAVR
jgi:mannosyltransferase